MYPTPKTIQIALSRLFGTADHMLKIWFCLKQMGMTVDNPVTVDTSSPTDSLKRLFSYGDPDGDFLVPFAHTDRFLTMKKDAARSIIQTNIVRWCESGSVVGVDPTDYLDIEKDGNVVNVKPGRRYPMGLGYGVKGFAREDNARVMVPDLAFAIWYFRQTDIAQGATPAQVVLKLLSDLHITSGESECVFVPDSTWIPEYQATPLTDKQLYETVTAWRSGSPKPVQIVQEAPSKYSMRIHTAMSIPEGPAWLSVDPAEDLKKALSAGAKAILLYGPPRTGKTRAIDKLVARTDSNRVTIQIHEGWGYDELMVSLRPQVDGSWAWKTGPLLQAIKDGKKYIVLEEINRTQATQALGEIFSLIEDKYRGPENSITLRNGEQFFIPKESIFIATMNTIDKSTEDLDDGLLGRFATIEYPTRVEDLISLLKENGVKEELANKLRQLFTAIKPHYPLGHGYFIHFQDGQNPIDVYKSRLRPVLQSHLKGYRDNDLASIDETVDQLFG